MIIIGIAGKAGHGKDTVADILEPRGYRPHAFATKLKELICKDLFDLSHEQVYGNHKVKEKIDPRYDISPREILQKAGEAMRRIYPDIWVEALLREIEHYEKFTFFPEVGDKGVVVTDVRHMNEIRALKASGAMLWLVQRPGITMETGLPDHPSESELELYHDWDAVIKNDGTLPELKNKVEDLLTQYNNKEQT